jgi:hypothetical protein
MLITQAKLYPFQEPCYRPLPQVVKLIIEVTPVLIPEIKEAGILQNIFNLQFRPEVSTSHYPILAITYRRKKQATQKA